jgi:hypothetical protein
VRRSTIASALALLALAAVPRTARADALDADTETVSVRFELEGDVYVKAADKTFSCTAPCQIALPRGYVNVKTSSTSQEIFVDENSRVFVVQGSSGVRMTSGVVTLVAIGVTIAGVLTPIFGCHGERRFDATGREYETSPCKNISTAVGVAWFAGAGIAFATAIVGGIIFLASGPHLKVESVQANAAGRRVASAPFFRVTTLSEDRDAALGLSLALSF